MTEKGAGVSGVEAVPGERSAVPVANGGGEEQPDGGKQQMHV